MARWVQRWDEDQQKYVLVPADQAAYNRDVAAGRHNVIVRGKFDAFKSHVDGSIISTHRQFVEHCRRHGVVPTQEFDQGYFDRKAAERAKFYRGEHSPQESFRRKQEIHEIINRLENRNE